MAKTIVQALLFFIPAIYLVACVKEKAIAPAPAAQMHCANDTITFVNNIKPIFQTNCAIGSCHVAGGQAPFDATDYSQVILYINNGALTNAINHSGALPMPRTDPADPLNPAAIKLPDSTINKIECWISNGFPEE